jgi:hypothetical protein
VAQITSAEFEALWESAKSQPAFRKVEPAPIKADLSLAGILDRYLEMTAGFRDKGRVSQIDHDALAAAVHAMKAILVRINDAALVAEAMAKPPSS